MSKKPKLIIDPETAEVLGHLNENDLIIREESRKAFQEKKKKQRERNEVLKTKGIFVQVLHIEERKIEKELNLQLCVVLLDLFQCITRKNKNDLVHTDGEREGQRMNATDISLHLGKSERQTKRDLNELVNLEALICKKNPKNKRENFYSLNSTFFTTTTREGPDIGFTKVFQKKLNEVRSKLTKNEYGALLKFIRNFHHQTYYLVRNPDHNIIVDPKLSVAGNLNLDVNEFVLDHLNQKQLAEIIGIERQQVSVYVKAFEKAGIMMVQKQHKNHRFIIHPDLMFRKDEKGDDEYTETIRAQFKQLKSKPKKKRK